MILLSNIEISSEGRGGFTVLLALRSEKGGKRIVVGVLLGLGAAKAKILIF
jgi:hypothetical protein